MANPSANCIYIRPMGWSGPWPPTVRYEYRGRTYWCSHWAHTDLWTIEPDDDRARLIKCPGNWRDAIDEFERDE